MPEYSVTLLKKNSQTNDDEIFEKVISQGQAYYKYYAITQTGEEKYYVANKEEAENIIARLKEKESNNIEKLGYIEKYSTELSEFTDIETAVSKLYEEKPVIRYASIGTSINTGAKVNLGINLVRPVSGTITSRFGSRWGGTHTGLDIGANTGTAIKAAAAGTVVKVERRTTSYGYLVIIAHNSRVQTYYAHCSAIYVKEGQHVSQGEVIAAVGSTGNSTGPHLHLEVRVNGVAQNPQNYIY